MKATLDSECQSILVLTETDHTVLLIDKDCFKQRFWCRQLQCERSDETLVLASLLGADLVIRKGVAHAKSAVSVSTGMKRHGRSFNDNPKSAESDAGFCERLCKSDGVPSLVEPVACPVLSRSCFGVGAQQLVATDPDSTVRRNPWMSGAKVNEESHPQVLGRKFLEERLSICRHKHPFTSLISVCRDDGVCCVFTLLLNLALFNLTAVINKRAPSRLESVYLGLLHW